MDSRSAFHLNLRMLRYIQLCDQAVVVGAAGKHDQICVVHFMFAGLGGSMFEGHSVKVIAAVSVEYIELPTKRLKIENITKQN